MAGHVKAIGLLSGGLDSVLAVALLKQQGIEVTGLLVRTGFTDHKESSPDGSRTVSDVANALGIPLRIEDISREYWTTLFYPKHGYGKNMNPCLDCHLHMVRVAARIMREEGADFVFTGEVMGQRPKSQMAHQLKTVLEESGISGSLLRPLSALRLAPTIPELEGKVDRSRLKGFFGRQRGPQLALARELGVEHLAVAAGGNCFLTNKEFSDRFKDHLAQFGKEHFPKEDVPLLRIGRHFRLSPSAKVIISRNEEEYELLQPYKNGKYVFELLDVTGASALGTGTFSEEDLILASQLTGRYSKAVKRETLRVRVTRDDWERIIETTPLDKDDPRIEALRI